MSRLIRFRQKGGFTIAELLVVLVIVSILIIGIGRMFTRQIKTFSVQDETAKMQEQARMAEDLMLKTFQQTGGFTPTVGSSGATLAGHPILAATDHLLAVQYDDPVYTDHIGSIRAEEVVIFAVSKDSANSTETVTFDVYFDKNHDGVVDTINEKFAVSVPLDLSGPPYNLYRMTPNEANPSGGALTRDLVAQNVDNFLIRYFDNDGKQIPADDYNIKADPPYNLKTVAKDWRPNVRSLEVELTMRSSRPDPEYSSSYTVNAYNVGTYDATGAPRAAYTFPDEGYRRRTYKSMVTPRNLPTAPCGRMTLRVNNPVSPTCPVGTSITATVTDRYGNPPAVANAVLFSLPGGTAASIGPSLSGGVGSGAKTSVAQGAGGTATANLGYTGPTKSILVSAQTDIDCSDAGGPSNFTVTDAVSVTFLPGLSSKVIIDPLSTGTLASNPMATCPDPGTSPFTVYSYDECYNSVAPQAGYTLGVYDTAGPGAFYGELDGGTSPVELTLSEQDYTITAPIVAPADPTKRQAGTGLLLQYLREANRPVWVQDVYYRNGVPIPWSSAAPAEIVAVNAPSIEELYTKPWPPERINVLTDNITGSAGNTLPDCDANTRDATFQVLDCRGIDIWDLTGATLDALLTEGTSLPPLRPNDSDQLGKLSNSAIYSTPPLNTDLSLSYANATSSSIAGEFDLIYTNPQCQFSPPDFPVGTYAKPDISMTLTGGTNNPIQFTPWLEGCRDCQVTVTPDVVTTCAGFAEVTVSRCGVYDTTPPHDQVNLTIVGGLNAKWVTKVGNTWTIPAVADPTVTTVSLVANGAGGATATAWLAIGDTPNGEIINVTASSAEVNPSGNPVWSCQTANPLTVSNSCQGLKAYYTTVDAAGQQGPKVEITHGGSLCAAGINYLFVELNHCLSVSPLLMPDRVYVQIRNTKTGQVVDTEEMLLTAVPVGVLPATLFNNFSGGLRVAGLGLGGNPTTLNNLLEYPAEGSLELIVRQWVSATDLNDACPTPAPAARLPAPPGSAPNNPGDIVAPFTQPLPLCFPNAITSGGGASWNGNFKVHWGDVVVRGLVTAPSKLILKPDAPPAVALPPTPTNGPPQFNEAPFLGNNYTDRFVDIYVGHSQGSVVNAGTCTGVDSGCIDGAAVPIGTPVGTIYQPFKGAGYGNYFTNISYGKITQMIVTLNYDIMKTLAKGRGTYWITVSDDKIWNPSHSAWGVLDISTVLMDPPNAYYNGEFIFVDTYTPGPGGAGYLEPYDGVVADGLINAAALAGTLPTHTVTGAGGFYTKGIIYVAGNMDFGGLGGTGRPIQSVAAPTPPQRDSRYDHNTAAFSENDLPIRPNPAEAQGNFTLTVHINGAIYVDGAYGGAGNPSIFGAITGEQGYSGSGTPEVWYNYTLNQSGIKNAICVQCCNITASPATMQLYVGGASQVIDIYGSSGALVFQSSNPNIASIQQISNTQYRIIPGNQTGSADLWFADINNCSVTVPVSVSTTCLGYYLDPSGIFPAAVGAFDVGMTEDVEVTNGTSTYGAGNWTWSTTPNNGVVSLMPSNVASNVITAAQCGNTTVSALDNAGVCPGPYEVDVYVTSPLAIRSVSAGPYNLGTTAVITLDGVSGAALDCTATAGSTCTQTAANQLSVVLNSTPTVTVSINDTGYGATCTPLTQTFTIACERLAPGITLNSPSLTAAQNYYGSFGNMGSTPANALNLGSLLNFQVTPNDNSGDGDPLNMIERVEFTVNPTDANNSGANSLASPDFTTPYVGFGPAAAPATNDNDVSYWTDRYNSDYYTLTATAYTVANACGDVDTASTSTRIYVRNCLNDVFGSYDTGNWDPVTCGPNANACTAYDPPTISGSALRLSVTTSGVGNNSTRYHPVLFERMDVSNFPLAFDTTKFEVSLDVKAIDRQRSATAKAGLRIQDSSGRDITVMGSGGTNNAENPVVTMGGVQQTTNVLTALTGTVTYRAVYTYSGGTASVTLYARSNTVAEYAVGTYTLTGFSGALAVGPYFDAPDMRRSRTATADFDNWNLCKRGY